MKVIVCPATIVAVGEDTLLMVGAEGFVVYSSALGRERRLYPPATSTLPLSSNVAV